MEDHRITYLFYRYFDGLATSSEKEELAQALSDKDKGDQVKRLMGQAWAAYTPDHDSIDEKTSESILRNVLRADEHKKVGLEHSWQKTTANTWWYAAASVLVILGLTLYMYRLPRLGLNKTSAVASQNKSLNILPGSNKAVLTLADGREIDLERASEGLLSRQGSSEVSKSENGQLVYQASGARAEDGHLMYNTVSTPRGGQFQITLPDGSRVWLNAASSIRYPAAFIGRERLVKITGEAYFEVAKNEAIPFMVESGDMRVQVLGTHFNVNAYDDETLFRTTLLEGAVRISNGHHSAILHPGQQADVGRNKYQAAILIRETDVQKAIAWKEGVFHFDQAGLPDVMRQLARWYDVEVSYLGNITPREFGGEISRQANLVEVLKILEVSNVHFRVEGRKITVTP